MARGSETGGCLNCYAAAFSARNLNNLKSPTTGKSFARILPSGPRWTGEVELIEKALLIPMGWKDPRLIFVDSMSDLFHEELTDEEIHRVYAVMALCHQHTFQVLTKRPERRLKWYDPHFDNTAEAVGEQMRIISGGKDAGLPEWPLPNVWEGTSIENPPTAEMRIPSLLATPAAIHFLSYEPALDAVDLRRWLYGDVHLDWVIIGGESGPGARPFDIRWALDTIRDCREANVSCFLKQLGAKPRTDGFITSGPKGIPEQWLPGRVSPTFSSLGGHAWREIHLHDKKGEDITEWPPAYQVQQFPTLSSP